MSNRNSRVPTFEATFKPNSGAVGDRATKDMAALLLGKLLHDLGQGDEPYHATLDDLMEDPKRVLAVLIIMTNVTAVLAHRYYPGGLQTMCDKFIEQAVS